MGDSNLTGQKNGQRTRTDIAANIMAQFSYSILQCVNMQIWRRVLDINL